MAYRATTWVLDSPDGRVPLRLSSPLSPGVVPLPAGIVTAFNPGSVLRDPAENRRANAELHRALQEIGAVPIPCTALGVGPDAERWTEPGFAVAGLPRTALVALAQRFGQNAIVWIDAAGHPSLVATRPGFCGRAPGDVLP